MSRLIEVTAAVDDPELMAKVEERIMPGVGKKTADELARAARDALKRLNPTCVQRRGEGRPR